jgi:PAS domain S-box-containing protein
MSRFIDTLQGRWVDMFWTQELANRLVEVIKTGIILTDTKGTILFVNHLASQMFAYAAEDLNGLRIDALFLPDDRDVLFNNVMKLNTDGAGFDGEALFQKKDGTPFFVNLSSALYKGELPSHELIIFTVQDISRLKRMEKDRIESERFAGLGAMADQISHQIRNPIVAIGGFALRLAKDQVSIGEYSRYSNIIHTEAQRLENIIDRLAEFTQTRSRARTSFLFSELFLRMEKSFESFLDGNIVKVLLPRADEIPVTPVYGDLSRLSVALESVIRNGIEAIGESGEVSVSGVISSNTAVITVKDNGEGISEKNFPFLFDPFFSTKFNYLGLGLTLAKRIIEEHKGSIVVGKNEGKGTAITIELPTDRRRSIRTKLL